MILICIGMGALSTWPLLRHPLDLPYDPTSDTLLFSWSFWWLKDSIVNWHNPFYSTTIFYPEQANLAMATLALPYGVLYLIVSWLPQTLAFPLSFFFFILFTFAMTGLTTFLLGRELGLGERASLYAGIFVTISATHLENLGRVHLGCMELPIGAIVLLLRVLKSETRRGSYSWGAALGIVVTLLLLSSQTYSLYFLIIGSVLSLALFVREPGRILRTALPGLLLAAAVFFVLSWPYISALRDFTKHYPTVPLGSLDPDLLRFVLPGLNQATYRTLFPGWTFNWGNHLFMGLFLYGFAIAGIKRFYPHLVNRKVFFGLAIAGFTLCLGSELIVNKQPVGLKLPYHYLKSAIPILQADRSPDRFFFLTLLVLGLLAGCGADRLLDWLSKYPKLARYATIALPVLLGLEVHVDSYRYHKVDRYFSKTLETAAQRSPGSAVMGLPPQLDSKHTFFLQARTGAAVLDADYPRVSPLLGYSPLRKANLLELFKEPAQFKVLTLAQRQSTCDRINVTLSQNRIETVYVLDDAYAMSFGARMADTREILTACGWKRIDPGPEKGLFLQASVWVPQK